MCLISKVINPALAAGLFNAGVPQPVHLSGLAVVMCLIACETSTWNVAAPCRSSKRRRALKPQSLAGRRGYVAFAQQQVRCTQAGISCWLLKPVLHHAPRAGGMHNTRPDEMVRCRPSLFCRDPYINT